MIPSRMLSAQTTLVRNIDNQISASAINPERNPFLARELRIKLDLETFNGYGAGVPPLDNAGGQDNSYPPSPSFGWIDLRYADKPITNGWVPLAALSEARRPMTEFLFLAPWRAYELVAAGDGGPDVPQATSVRSAWKSCFITYRFPTPILLIPGMAELSMKLAYRDAYQQYPVRANPTIHAPPWNDLAILNNFNCSVVLVGEETTLKQRPKTIDVPYIAAWQDMRVPATVISGDPSNTPAITQNIPAESNRTHLRNATRKDLIMSHFHMVIGNDSSVFYSLTRSGLYPDTYSVEDTQVRLYDWKGRSVTPKAPFADVFPRVSRIWRTKAIVPPGAFYRASVTEQHTAPLDTSVGQTGWTLSMHGHRTETL